MSVKIQRYALAVSVGVYLMTSPIDPKPLKFDGAPLALEGHWKVNNRDTGSFLASLRGLNHLLLMKGTSTDYEPVCALPHGLRLDRKGQLIVADSYLPLFWVDPQGGEKTLLLSSKEGAEGIPFGFLNGLEISQNGTVFFTDSSSRWGRRYYEVIETDHLGRLLAYDPKTGLVKLLLDSLFMPNGIALSLKEDFLLMAETSIGRMLRYWLKGPKAGTKEVPLNNMPGYPDNIQSSDRDMFLMEINTIQFCG